MNFLSEDDIILKKWNVDLIVMLKNHKRCYFKYGSLNVFKFWIFNKKYERIFGSLVFIIIKKFKFNFSLKNFAFIWSQKS